MRRLVVGFMLLVIISTSAAALEKRAFQIREDFASEPLQDCALQYYYYIPCATYAWFWGWKGWEAGDVVGQFFQLGDMTTGDCAACDPSACHMLRAVRVLDFAGYCNYPRYPDLCTVEIDIYCADEYGCPIGPSLWNSGHYWRMYYGWNYVEIDPPISVCGCCVNSGPPPSAPRILVAATHGGTYATYPTWGCDVISYPVLMMCDMHDYGCLPALYPRPYNSHYEVIHSGFYGKGFQYCPPQRFPDGNDSTPDASIYGFTELAWRIYLICSGPTEVESATWSEIKSMYK